MSTELFWNNREIFEKRKEVILQYLNELDRRPYLHYRISSHLYLAPKNYDEEVDKRHIVEIFILEPSRFKGPGRVFVILSNDKNFLIGTGPEGLSFTCEEIKTMEFNLYNDYMSQVILHFILQANLPAVNV